MSQERFLEIVKDGYKSTELAWATSANKWDIANAKWKLVRGVDDNKTKAWGDLQTRAQSAAKFYDNTIRNLLREAYEYGGGDVSELKRFKKKRIATPVTFDQELCAVCRSLESSFVPTDAEQRISRDPWYEQYIVIFEDMVSDTYRTMAMGLYFDSEMDLIRADLSDGDMDLALKRWDMVIEGSRNFLYYGRNCFSDSERIFGAEFVSLQKSRQKRLEVVTKDKYIKKNEDTLKAIGGLYSLNTELLCEDCKSHIEVSPIKWGL